MTVRRGSELVPAPPVSVTVAPHPFRLERRLAAVAEGPTIADIVERFVPDPVYRASVIAFSRGRVIPRRYWPYVRPRGGAFLELRAVPAGGGGGGGKVLRTVLTIAVLAAAVLAPAAAGLLGVSAETLGGSLIGTLTVGQALTGVVAIGGLLAVNALVPNRPPKLGALSGVGGSPTLFLEGARNQARPFDVIPVVLGRYRATPPFGAAPVTEVIGSDQYLRLLFVWGIGPLAIDADSLRIGETPLTSFEGVSVEHREGFPDDEPLTLYGAGGESGSGGETIYEEPLSAVLPDLPYAGPPYPTGASIAPSPTPYGYTDVTMGLSEVYYQIDAPWVTRTSQPEATALSVDVTLTNGLYKVDPTTGNLYPGAILIQVQFRKLGDSTWTGVSWVRQSRGSTIIVDDPWPGPGQAYLRDADDRGRQLNTLFGVALSNPGSFFENEGLAAGVGAVSSVPMADVNYAFSGYYPGTYWRGLTYYAQSTSPLRFGIRWPVPETAQYEVRVRAIRESLDPNRSTPRDQAAWTALRTVREGDPIQTGVGGAAAIPLARTALLIRATDQLSGVVDELSGIVQSYAPVWTGSAWTDASVDDWVPTSNPAALYRLVLQGNGIAEPLSNDRLDLEGLGEWYDFCEDLGLEFNMVRDFSSSVWETLLDVSAAGRAAPTQVDGKWGVVIEREQTTPVSHITPRNSSNFRVERVYVDPPHAWRIRFPNEDEDYRQDERRVYADGYDEDTATKFEALELPGVTSPDQVQLLGRFRIAQGSAQAERWSWRQDLEFLTYQRGDRVAVTHDVLLVGLASGRIKSVEVDTNDDVTAVTVDEALTMSAGSDYGLAIRTAAAGQVTGQIVTAAGNQTTVTFSTPVAATSGGPTIAAGELFGFGLLGSETDDATVIAIAPENDLRARVIAVPYRPVIFDPDAEVLPPFDSNLTPLPTIPAPTISSVVSDLTVATVENGVLVVRVALNFTPFDATAFGTGATTELQARRAGTTQAYGSTLPVDQTTASSVVARGVSTAEIWDLRLRFVVPGQLPGPWTYRLGYEIVGTLGAPNGLDEVQLTASGGTAHLTWTPPTELDVVYGGEIRFRHDPATSGATWATATPIGTADPNAGALDLPLLAGTYLARVFDAGGEFSADVASVVTEQVDTTPFSVSITITEDPDFGGTLDDGVELLATSVSGEYVLHLAETSFDEVPDIDTLADWDLATGVALSGTYDFEDGADLGTSATVRVRRVLSATAVPGTVGTDIDERVENIDDWSDFDLIDVSEATAKVQFRTTPDDPAATDPAWGPWTDLVSTEVTARGFEFRALLATDDRLVNVEVDSLGAIIETPNFA